MKTLSPTAAYWWANQSDLPSAISAFASSNFLRQRNDRNQTRIVDRAECFHRTLPDVMEMSTDSARSGKGTTLPMGAPPRQILSA
jgi:hypothetical protein